MMTALVAVLALAAQATTVEVKHRITGLFEPARVDELKESFKKVKDAALVSLDYERAEAVLSYDPKKMSGKKTDPEREKEIVERLDQLLKQASNHTFGVKPLSTTPKDKQAKLEIPVLGLDCRACCLSAYEVLAKEAGVDAATCDFKKGLMTALIDPEKTNRAALVEALKKRQVTVKD